MHGGEPTIHGRYFDRLSVCVPIVLLLVTGVALSSDSSTPSTTLPLLCDGLRQYADLQVHDNRGRYAISVNHDVLDVTQGYISDVIYTVRMHSNGSEDRIRQFVITSLQQRSTDQFAGNFTASLPSHVGEVVNCGRMNALFRPSDSGTDDVVMYWKMGSEDRGIGCVEFRAIIQGEDYAWFKVSKLFCERPGNEIPGCMNFIDETADGGVLVSPNYPNQYPDEVDCYTFLHNESSSRIFLQFSHFDIEYEQQCAYDFVNIYVDGVDESRPHKFCGQYDGTDLQELWFQSVANTMVVQLSSDFKYGGQGYLAKFYSLDINEGCNVTFTNDSLTSGIVQSWNYPNTYFPNLMCYTLIKLDPQKRIRLKLLHLQMQSGTTENDCDRDYVRILEGNQPGSSSILCGEANSDENHQLVFDSAENEMEVLFSSDYLIEKTGFYGEFYALDSCVNQTVVGMGGQLSSPNYPDNYPNSQDCFITIEVPRGNVLLTFESFDMQTAAEENSCNDYLEILTGNETFKVCGNWQGKQNQLVYKSVSSIMHIHFVTDGRGTAKGFQAVYSAVDVNITQEIIHPNCPTGWIQFKQNCYEIVHVEKTWSEAAEACEVERTQLASIHTLQEQLFLNSAIQNSARHINGAYWIGGHDREYEAEYMWQDNSIFNFTDWFPGWSLYNMFSKQPSDDGFSEEDCVELRQVFHFPSKGQGTAERLFWNDRNCLSKNGYICKQLAFGAEVPNVPTKLECDQFFNASDGTITSFSYPRSYANNMDCTVTIEVTQGYRIYLEFSDFVVEEHGNCKYDFVKIFTPGEQEIADTFCGNQNANIKLLRRVTTSNVLIIRFHTDHSRTFKGFRAIYWTEPVPLYCDNTNWIYNDGICYLINWGTEQQSSWAVSNALCQEHNATLARTASQQQYYFIEESIRWNSLYKSEDVFWLSGNDIKEEGQWVWHDGMSINSTFDAWFDGWSDDIIPRQPSGQSNEDCLAITQMFPTSDGATKFADKMYWMDELCNVKANFICQKKSNSSLIQYPQIQTLLTSYTGNISSPHFPNHYENNLDNITIIEVPSGFRIKVEFLAFNLEYHKSCLYDYLSLNDSIQYEVFCGNLSAQLEQLTFWSLTNQTVITFHSDHAITDIGYSANYKAVDVASCANQVVEGRTGIVTSFNFPDNYLNSLSCKTTIQVTPGYRVFLEFETFQLHSSPECLEDYVVLILDGWDEKRTSRYCGDRTAQVATMKFVSYESVLSILFHSNERNVSRGFSATFTAVKELTTVINLESQFTANFVSSLNYPLPYPEDTNLTLIIRAPPNGHVVVSFSGCLSLNLYNCTSSALKAYNYLLYEDKEEVQTSICGDTCNRTDNLVFQSTLNTLEIQFISQTNLAQRQGFQARYYTKEGNDSCGAIYCSGRGSCRYRDHQYYCSCDNGYRGPFCEIRQGETGKTLLQRLMDDPFWIGIIAIIVFLLLGLFIVFLRKKISKHLQNKREEKLRNNLGKNVRFNAGSSHSFVDSSSPSPHLNGDSSSRQLHNGNSVSYDPSRVNEIALHEIGIHENGHAVAAKDGEYDEDDWDEEMDGENDGRRESGPRYLERHATVATALGRVVPAVALSSVKAKRYHKRNPGRPPMEISFLRGPKRFIPNIWKQRGNDPHQDTGGSKPERYLRTRKQVEMTPPKMVVVIQNEPMKTEMDDPVVLREHQEVKQSKVTDGDYLNKVFVSVHEETGLDENGDVKPGMETSEQEEESDDVDSRKDRNIPVHEYTVAELHGASNWQGPTETEYDIVDEAGAVAEMSGHAALQPEQMDEWQDPEEDITDYSSTDCESGELHGDMPAMPDGTNHWEAHQSYHAQYGVEELYDGNEDLVADGNIYTYEYDNTAMPDVNDEINGSIDVNDYRQYSSASHDSSVDLSDIQTYRGRSRPSLRSLHRQPVIFESIDEGDPVLDQSDDNGYRVFVDDAEKNGLVTSTDVTVHKIGINAFEMRSLSRDSGEGRFSDSDKETVILSRTVSQKLSDSDGEQNNHFSSFERTPSNGSDVSAEDVDDRGHDDVSETDQTQLRRQRLTYQKTSSNFSDLEPIEEGTILRTEDLWENQRLDIDSDCTENCNNNEEIV